MKELQLIKGGGRTGNFIICLMNAILYSKRNHYDIIDFSKITLSPSPDINTKIMNDFFKKTNIIITKENINDEIVEITQLFFTRLYKTIPLTFEERIELVHHYIKPIMHINNHDIKENDLVIHLRSGDIMVGGNPEMIQPPLEFYEKVINYRKWDKIYLLTERHPLNPIFNVLVKKYNPITFVDDNRDKYNGYNFKKDFDYLISATHYVPCQSSLCPFIIQLSDTIKNVYVPSYFFIRRNSNYNWWTSSLFQQKTNKKINDIEFHIFNYDEYINTKKDMHIYIKNENKDLLLEYKSETPYNPSRNN